MPFLLLEMRYIAASHVDRGSLLFSITIPVVQLNFFAQPAHLKRLPDSILYAFAWPQWGHWKIPSGHLWRVKNSRQACSLLNFLKNVFRFTLDVGLCR